MPAAQAGVIASSNFTDGTAANSFPAVTWTPSISLSANVPAAGNSAYLISQGTVDQGTNLAYLGTYVNQTQASSSSVSSYRWQWLSGALGPTGEAGTPLVASPAVSYVHVAYATSAAGAGFTLTSPTTTHLYVGSYSSTSATPSTNPASYTWQLWSSIPPNGTGLANRGGTYFHIAYATSATGTGFTQTRTSETTYVGTYVDNLAPDSTNPTDYTWRAFSSIAAGNGIPGVSTVDAQTYYLHLKYSQDGGQTFTANTGNTPYVYPAAAGAPTKALQISADFSAVASSATSWAAEMLTPYLTISNAETVLERLNVSFDLKSNRKHPVKVRLYSYTATGTTPTGFVEGVVYPIAINALYRYSLDLSTMTQGSSLGGSNFVATGANGARVRFAFRLEGSSTDATTWQRVNSNYVTVDNICYTNPSYYVSPTGLATNSGLTPTSPKPIDEVMNLVQPGDVICLNGGVYTSSSYVIPMGGVAGTPSRWITIRPTSASSPVTLRTKHWSHIDLWSDNSYIDIRGLIFQGYYDGEGGAEATAENLSIAEAALDAARLNSYGGFETNPAYTVYTDHNLSSSQKYVAPFRDAYGNEFTPAVSSKVPVNGTSPAARFNTAGIGLTSNRAWNPAFSRRSYTTTGEVGRTPHHIRIADNTFFNLPGGAIGSRGGDYIYVERNVLRDNNKLSRYGGSGISFLAPVNFDGSSVYRMVIIANTAARNGLNVRWGPRIRTLADGRKRVTLNWSDGNGIILDTFDQYEYNGRSLVVNNVTYGHTGSGIHALHADNVDIVNNTSFRNGVANNGAPYNDFSEESTTPHTGAANSGPYATYTNVRPAWMNISGGGANNYGEIFAQDSFNVNIRNNILWAASGKKISADPKPGTDVTYDNNLFGRDGGFTTADEVWKANAASYTYNKVLYTATAGDVFENFTNYALPTYLRLRTAAPVSPAINGASSPILWSPVPLLDRRGVQRPLGGGYDIGAYEDL